MRIFCFSGLGADHRVFDSLDLNHELVVVEWIKQELGESLRSYSKRLALGVEELIKPNEDFALLGVSFGGVVAGEVSNLLEPKFTILVSTVVTESELNRLFRLLGSIGILSTLPSRLFKIPAWLSRILFQPVNQKLLNKIVDETDLEFVKWSLNALARWKNKPLSGRVLRIHGGKDRIILKPKNYTGFEIANGSHFAIVNDSKEISNIINKDIKMSKCLLALTALLSLIVACGESSAHTEEQAKEQAAEAVERTSTPDTNSVLYSSEILEINKLSASAYVHVSYIDIEQYGKFPCNGLVYVSNGEAIIVDTPIDSASTLELIDYLEGIQQLDIVGFLPSHFHVDCLGGIQAIADNNIPIYLHNRTASIIGNKNLYQNITYQEFSDNKEFYIGSDTIAAKYYGAGHTSDNIVVYNSKENLLFGGCLIKSVNAGKGNLEDADVEQWPKTVELIKNDFPNIPTVIPGHGDVGDATLLEYTIQLFQQKPTK